MRPGSLDAARSLLAPGLGYGSTSMDPVALELQQVRKVFRGEGDASRVVLDDANLGVATGTSTAIVGRSGSGKSTLLHLAAGIELPDLGTVRLLGRDLSTLDDAARSRLRRDAVGLVFQFFHLVPHFSTLENVLLPAWIAADPATEARARALALLARVGLADRARDLVGKLSGGEQQRVALCRALLRRPPLVLADEPTGNLDDRTSREVMDLLFAVTTEEGRTLVFVTHSRELALRADRTLQLRDGRLETA